jgi:hypothetical protein
MTTTTIRTTCGSCHLTAEIPVTSLILTLPSPCGDPTLAPSFLHICVGCRTCASTSVPWRTGTYLLLAGATALTAPDLERIRPRYPEARPASTSPMTLDDLLDLHAALDSDASAL